MKNVFLAFSFLLSLFAQAQVGIGTPSPNSSAMLEVNSSNKGVLFPSMSSTQRLAIPSPATGLLVFQTDAPSGFYYYTGSAWTSLASQDNSGVPAGTIMAYAGSTAPSGWAFCDGSAVSRTVNSTLFAAISTTYGTGNGSTTFNLPDLRGRTVFGKDDMGGTAANRLTNAAGGITGTTLGASGGAQSFTLGINHLPAHNHGVSLTTSTDGSHYHNYVDAYFAESGGNGYGGNSVYGLSANSDYDNSFRYRTSGNSYSNSPSSIPTDNSGSHSHTVSGSTALTGSGAALALTNPGLVLNYIIKL